MKIAHIICYVYLITLIFFLHLYTNSFDYASYLKNIFPNEKISTKRNLGIEMILKNQFFLKSDPYLDITPK